MAVALVPSRPNARELIALTVQSCESPRTRMEYSRCLARWLARGVALDRSEVLRWLGEMRDAGKGAVTRNIHLAAVRKLAKEAWARGLLADAEMSALERIPGAPVRGERLGNWIDERSAEKLIQAAGRTAYGTRNQAILALMLGCGLRRSEVAGLQWSQWQQRSGRWVVCDLKGKGGRKRSVPAPKWVARYVEAWKEAANVDHDVANWKEQTNERTIST